jgi:DNA-binding response OmpR family regulator
MVQNSPSQYPRALIVEDETMIALGLEAHLRELGFQPCDLAADGPQAVSHAMSEVPDAPVLPKPIWGDRLAEAVESVMKFRMW